MRNSYFQVIKQLDEFVSACSVICTLEDLSLYVEKILKKAFYIENTEFYLFDPAEDRLKLHFSKGFTNNFIISAEQTVTKRHPGFVYHSGNMLYTPDTLIEGNMNINSAECSAIVRSQLYLPVKNGDQILGVLGIADSKPNAYNEEDIATLSFICSMVGMLYDKILNQTELQRQALIAKEIGNAIVISNQKGEIEWVNDAFTRLTEYKLEEIKGKTPGEFLQGEETDPKTVFLLSQAIKNKNYLEVDIVNYSKSQNKYWVKIQIQPVFDTTGKLENFISIQKEITKEKEIEQKLIDG